MTNPFFTVKIHPKWNRDKLGTGVQILDELEDSFACLKRQIAYYEQYTGHKIDVVDFTIDTENSSAFEAEVKCQFVGLPEGVTDEEFVEKFLADLKNNADG